MEEAAAFGAELCSSGCNGGTAVSGGTGVLSCTAAPVQAVCVGVELPGGKLHRFFASKSILVPSWCVIGSELIDQAGWVPPYPCFFFL